MLTIRSTSDRRPTLRPGPAGRGPGVVILCLLLLALSLSASAATRLSAEEQRLRAQLATKGETHAPTLFALADHCHDLGVEGDKAAVGRAEDYLRKLLDAHPTNAPAMALMGSVYTLKARDAFWPPTQLRLVREGNEWMDRAVAIAPEDVQTRLIRVLNNAHMPDFLGRAEIVRADLAWIWEKIEKDPARFTASTRQQVALHWGRRLKKDRDAEKARRVLETGLAFDPQSSHAAELKEELEKLR